MPRPKKCRKVCQMPEIRKFQPVGENLCRFAVVLSVDEYEAIRLIDKQGFSQEECGKYMQIARTTMQMIYGSTRKKIAEALVCGLPLKIEGGDFKLCDGKEEYCSCGGCRKHRRNQIAVQNKEDGKMRIAIPIDENKQDICIVLSRAPYFLFQDEDLQTIVDNPAADEDLEAFAKGKLEERPISTADITEIRKFTEKSVIIKITAPYKNCADIKGADDEYIVVNFFKKSYCHIVHICHLRQVDKPPSTLFSSRNPLFSSNTLQFPYLCYN